jgi:hypothetical protein
MPWPEDRACARNGLTQIIAEDFGLAAGAALFGAEDFLVVPSTSERPGHSVMRQCLLWRQSLSPQLSDHFSELFDGFLDGPWLRALYGHSGRQNGSDDMLQLMFFHSSTSLRHTA